MSDNSKKITLSALLQAAGWAAGLTSAQMEHAIQGTTERRVAAGGFVYRKGQRAEHWYGVIEGLVKMSTDQKTGKTATYTGISTAGWFGEGSVLKGGVWRYDVIALRPARLACMNRETFLWLLDHSIAFNRFVMMQLNERLGMFIGLLESERLFDTDARVARSLAALFNPALYPQQDAQIDISQAELGHLSGVSRQRVNRSLQVLADAGLLSVKYGGVRVVDLEGLRRFGG